MAKIITVPNPLLKEKSKAVPLNQETLALVNQLNETLKNTEGTKGVGISAIQIGIPKRVFVAYSNQSRKFLVFINPELVWQSKRLITGVPRPMKLEGCLSVPGIWGLVKRHQVIKLRYQTPSGQTITRRFRGFLGVICQHEYDHLEGILFTDRVLQQKGKLFELKKDEEGKEKLVEMKLE